MPKYLGKTEFGSSSYVGSWESKGLSNKTIRVLLLDLYIHN